jgi:heme exporter protein A
LWILDEPFSALDAASVARLSERIGGHVLGGGTVLLTTHQEVVVAGIEARPLDVSYFNT